MINIERKPYVGEGTSSKRRAISLLRITERTIWPEFRFLYCSCCGEQSFLVCGTVVQRLPCFSGRLDLVYPNDRYFACISLQYACFRTCGLADKDSRRRSSKISLLSTLQINQDQWQKQLFADNAKQPPTHLRR
jgi:hypothetical protein